MEQRAGSRLGDSRWHSRWDGHALGWRAHGQADRSPCRGRDVSGGRVLITTEAPRHGGNLETVLKLTTKSPPRKKRGAGDAKKTWRNLGVFVSWWLIWRLFGQAPKLSVSPGLCGPTLR